MNPHAPPPAARPTATGAPRPSTQTVLAAVGGVAAVVLFLALVLAARADAGTEGLSPAAAVVLGLVEGLTEYLPVSSTGHLLVANEVMNLGGTPEADRSLDAYAICIQAGAILAVLVLYQERVRQMIDGLLGRSQQGRTVLIAVAAAFVPTAVIGLVLKDPVRDNLFGAPPVAAAWLVGGLAILALTRSGLLAKAGAELDSITIGQALLIGVGQCVALWPGTSRSLVTIVTAVLVGLSLRAAVEFSFLLGLVTLTAATALTALEDGSLLIDTFGVATPFVGLVVAFLAAVASVQWMVAWLERRSLDVFGWYRIAIGVIAFGAIAAGWL